MKATSIVLPVATPKGGSVRFDADPVNPKECIVSNVYVNRAAAAKHLGIENLDTVKQVKVTIEVEE